MTRFSPTLSIDSNKLATGLMLSLVALMGLMLFMPSVNAGVSGTEFQPLYDTLVGWMTGYMGRVIAVIFIIVGVIAGVGKSIMGFVMGIAAGVGMFLSPALVDNTVSATLPLIGL
jgi:conjugal transfer pilus assembly protein TraA